MKDKENLYIFLHIPKTAGMTFNHHVIKNLKKEEILTLYAGSRFFNLNKKRYDSLHTRKNVDNYLSSLTERRKNRIKFIYGHEVYYGIHKHFNKNPVYITFIRDPRERMVSAYNYNKTLINLPEDEFNALKLKPNNKLLKNINNRIKNKEVEHFKDLESWAKKRAKRSYQVLFLKEAKFIVSPKGRITKKEINEALDKFYFIGITESFDEDALFLYNKLGISKFCENKNVSKKFTNPEDHKSFLKKMVKKNKIGYKFYNMALRKNKDFKKRNPSFYIIVNYTKVKRMIYNLFNKNE